MSSRVQDGEQSVGTATTTPARPARPTLYEDALFLFIADGRVPTRVELLVFLLGFTASISLVFITSDLMNARPLRPATVLVFIASASYFGVLVRQQRIAAAVFAAEEERLAAEARQPRSEVIDRETRRRLLHYFAYCPPGNGKNGKEGGKASSITAFSSSFGNRGRDHGAQQELSDAIGSSGRGAKFSDSIRGVFSRLPPLSNPTPCPHPLRGATSPSSALASPLPTSPDMGEVGRVNAQESSRAGDCEEGGLAAVAAGGSSIADKSPEEDPGEAAADPIVGAKESTEMSVLSDATTKNASGLESNEVDGEGSAAESCIICFGDYAFGEELCRLPCRHLYHAKCIDEWLDGEHHGWCPLCKTDVIAAAAPVRSASGNNQNRNSSTSITSHDHRGWRRQRNRR